MKIKEKLTLGIVFLFIEFLVIALFGAYSIYSISQQSEKIMKDNNLSIQYAENMLQTIDQINALQLAILFNPSQKNHGNELAGLYDKFEKNLRKEADNVTEPGEKELLQVPNRRIPELQGIGCGDRCGQRQIRFLFPKPVVEASLHQNEELSYFGPQHAGDLEKK